MDKNNSKITEIFEILCRKHNYTFVISGSDKGYFIDSKDNKHNFDYGTIDLNNTEHIKIADDKEKACMIMRNLGIETPKEMVIKDLQNYSPGDLMEKINKFAERVRFPIILKPLNGRQGNNIFKINSKNDLMVVMGFIDEDLIVQKYLDFNEIRVVILDKQIIQAYERFRPYIIGDGRKRIFELIEEKNNYFLNNKRNTFIDINDFQTQNIIFNSGYSDNFILKKGEKMFLSYGRNLSKGGDYKFIENEISSELANILFHIYEATKLRLVGFDLFIKKNISEVKNKSDIVFIEYNASPDMENNFYYNKNYAKKLFRYYMKIFHAIIE